MTDLVTNVSYVSPLEYTLTGSAHGGNCCGISHIFNFENTHPDKEYDPLFEKWPYGTTVVRMGFSSQLIPHSYKKETGKERFLTILEGLKYERDSGLLEIVLVSDSKVAYVDGKRVIWNPYGLWKPIIEEAGFKETLSFWNSNSDNKVHVFHLVYGQERYDSAPSDAETFNPDGYDDDYCDDDYYDDDYLEDCDCEECEADRNSDLGR